MTIRVGIIGTGVMGGDHANTLVTQVPGASLKSVFDMDALRARLVAEVNGAETVASDPVAMIRDKSIDAILVASPDSTHKNLVLECIAAGKPVLCEKPLAPTYAECLEVVAAEAAHSKRLVQLGYMRRFDPGYVDMKAMLASGEIGQPLLFHCVHRNVSAPPWFDARMAISNSAVHEFDIARWLLDDNFESVHAYRPHSNVSLTAGSPVFLVLATAGGQLVTIEVFNDASYGYDVRAELVGERGTISLCAPAHTELNRNSAKGVRHAFDWRQRFAAAYCQQMRAWINGIRKGVPVGASAWDGYAATRIAEAGIESLGKGRQVCIEMAKMPALYE